jgi:hypothetical protein
MAKKINPETNLIDVLTAVDQQADKDVITNLRARVREHENTISNYQKSRGGLIDLAHEIAEAVTAVTPFPREYKVPKHVASYPIAAALNLSDLHIGEMIRPSETEGFGAFNYKIAEKRMFKLAEKIVEWVEMHRKTFHIPVLYIFGIGDYVSGDIHQELLVTNEFPLPVQTAKAGHLIGEFLRRLSPHFERIEFVGVGADNHGRLVKKPQAKQKAANNMSYLVHTIAQAYVANHKNISFELPESQKHLKRVAEHDFLIEHGDGIKAVLGIPYYGIERLRGREAARRMKTKKGFDYQVLGHWHVPAIVAGNIIMNGSLSGTTEFDHISGRHADPAQTSFLVHPKYGYFDFTAWRFAVEQEETDARRA